ncbi:hypothetical protein HanPSC8_Chr12g0523661 [Helianthus annuus]|nr:hypothetical protein HanPSC8_Chr12g0523661 [Helianthus annuus]
MMQIASSISLIKQTIGGHMSPNGVSQLSIHIGNDVTYVKLEDMWHSSGLRIGETSYIRFLLHRNLHSNI